MRPALVLLCLGGLMACDSSTSTNPTNTAISSALKPGMTEQQVAQVSNTRVPNRVVMQTCTNSSHPGAASSRTMPPPSITCMGL